MVGVDADEWNALVARGREAGDVHADEVSHVLRHVELSGDVLVQVQEAMAGQGITIDEAVEHIADDTPATMRRVVVESSVCPQR